MGKAAGGGGGTRSGAPDGEMEGADVTRETKPQEGAPTSPGGKALEEKRYLSTPPSLPSEIKVGPPHTPILGGQQRVCGV